MELRWDTVTRKSIPFTWSEIIRWHHMKGNDNACMHEVELRERKWKGNAKLIVEAWGGVKIRA